MKKFLLFITAMVMSVTMMAQTSNATVSIELGEVTTTTVEATFTPNADCASYYFMIGTASEMQMWASMMSVPLDSLVQMWGIAESGVYNYVWTDQTPDTEYTIYVLPLGADNVQGALVTQIVSTSQVGGTDTAVISIQVTVLSTTSVKTIATPNSETAVYHCRLIEKAFYELIGADSALEIIRGDNYPLYTVDEWIWLDLQPNTEYYALSTGQNANGEWGTTTLVPFVTSPEGIEEGMGVDFNIYPNPANNMITVSAQFIKTISVYNVMGQKIDEQEINSDKALIDVAEYAEGVYFVNIGNGITKRFVVSH